ncbi:MAG: hypothetical protein ACD_39C00213G0001 [uncultured bacterium]|nr:MAG: hypothetical protein ACD_39C00213G0001 [uncultured bacterium]
MSALDSMEVRVSRKLLLVLMLVGLLFLLVGLDIGYFHKLFDADMGQDKAIIKWVFLFFAVICGGAIFVNCLVYLFFPPLMLKVSKDKVIFGTRMRYVPFEVPAALVEKVESFTRESNLEVNGKKEIVDGGASLQLKNDPSIPSQKVTSMGISYCNYKLDISSTYANMSGKEIVEKVKAVLGKK